jgi:ankyrin repeat protein
VDARSTSGATPLHDASWIGRVNVVRSLLSVGANVKTFTREGKTPLSMACQHSHADVVRMLLSADAHCFLVIDLN